MTVSNKTMEKIMRQDSNLSPYDGFRIGGIGKVLNKIGLNQRKHHIIYKVSSGEFAIPMEFTGKLMFDIHPRIAYNLADQNFSRVLTLHQDFKRKDLMKEGNRPYSITYRIAYALSNTHHFDLFLRKEYIEIPRIFKEFAKQPVVGRYKGMLEMAGHEILVAGVAGRENGSMTLGLSFSKIINHGKEKGTGLIDSDSFYEESEEEIKNLKEALQELKTMDISEESKLSLENVKRLIHRNFSENPLAWWDRNKIEATLKIKEECKYEYVRYKPIQMNMEDKKDMQMIIKEHINFGLIEPGISAYSSPGFL
ncbi:UNVERIFIED_CONTAM: movement protein, partial [Sesamum radiatum]